MEPDGLSLVDMPPPAVTSTFDLWSDNIVSMSPGSSTYVTYSEI